MSAQFGKINFDNRPVGQGDFERVRAVLAPYGPDGEGSICQDNFGVLYRAFHTTEESRNEVEPHISSCGTVLTWDGRLDNREELIRQLHGEVSPASSTDIDVVAAAYGKWSTDSFSKLLGDWALSLWEPTNRSLILAKDFVGTRHLYYKVEEDCVTWCTILDPLVVFAGHSFALTEEYVAGWLGLFPPPHLTPYVGIYAVPPSSFVRLRQGVQRVHKYWELDPAKKIVYRADSEYEEHFRLVFSDSVRRRLRSDSPVLAELSGGVDSSSIVCIADKVGGPAADYPRVDTISYFDDDEPNWNERPYFTAIEAHRGQKGIHINAGGQSLHFGSETGRFTPTPAAAVSTGDLADQFAACLERQGSRVVLSGIGGDEFLGGVPTPTPELADLLAQGQFNALAHQLKLWALSKRKPWFYLLLDAIRTFIPPALVPVPRHLRPAPWLCLGFVRRNRSALRGFVSRTSLLGPLPSFQDNLATLDGLRRQLQCNSHPANPCHETRYPYLDRDLLEFVCAVPRQQLVRPGQRRSLMRRSLAGIVPDAVLNRRRKAFVARAPLKAVAKGWDQLTKRIPSMVSASLGIVVADVFAESLKRAREGGEIPTVTLLRTLLLEDWLRSILAQGYLSPTSVESLRLSSVPAATHREPASSREFQLTL
jgi:asparagine synthase (glutamine-hydrolysing)